DPRGRGRRGQGAALVRGRRRHLRRDGRGEGAQAGLRAPPPVTRQAGVMPWWPVRRPGPDRTSDDAVARAFAAVPRESFLPPAQRRRADHDGPIDIGHGQTNSQPLTVAAMLRLLDVRPRQRVLDVGAGSGWTTALLAT